MIVPEVGSVERTTPLMFTVWMLEKSENIPVPGMLVVLKMLPQEWVMFRGKVNLTTGGLAVVSRVPVQPWSIM